MSTRTGAPSKPISLNFWLAMLDAYVQDQQMPQLKSLTALPDALYPLGIDWTLHQFDMIKNKAGAKKDVMLNVFFC